MARFNASELMAQAGGLLRAGRLDEAERACKTVLKKEPRFFAVHHLLAIVAFRNEGVTDLQRRSHMLDQGRKKITAR